MPAGAFVESPQTGRLRDRQPQSGHFKKLRANSANEFVHDVTFDDLGEQNAVHAAGAAEPLVKSRVTPRFWADFSPERADTTNGVETIAYGKHECGTKVSSGASIRSERPDR